jgi:ribosomal-protein-alanine N-acetyltransferase
MSEVQQMFLRCVKEDDLEELHLYLQHFWPSLHLFRLAYFDAGFWSDEMGMQVLVREDRAVGVIWYEKDKSLDALSLSFHMFKEEDRGKGWMKEALDAFCHYLFATKKVERLQMLIPDYNKAALHLAQSARFQFEGIARRARFERGSYKDVCIYSRLRENL